MGAPIHRAIASTALHNWSVVLAIGLGVAFRFLLISNGWPVTNSDEANVGLQAIHILNRGELPVFVYGDDYNGSLEAYIGAFFFRVLEPSVFALRVGLVLMYGAFLVTVYVLGRSLYTRGVALGAVCLLCGGTSLVLSEQLQTGPVLEPPLFGALALVLAVWLARWRGADDAAHGRRNRVVAYALLGFAVGIGVWTRQLVLPFAIASLVLLVVFCRGELLGRAGLAAVVGMLVGAFPLVLFNLQHPDDNTLAVLWARYRFGEGLAPAGANLGRSVLGAFLVSIPAATGFHPLCPVSPEMGVLIEQVSPRCMAPQAAWGVALVAVWLIAVVSSLWWLRVLIAVPRERGYQERRPDIVRCAGRLALLGSAGLTIVSYATSPSAALFPVTTSRYLVGMWAAAPALVAVVWPNSWSQRNRFDAVKIGAVGVVGAVLLYGAVDTWRQIDDSRNLVQSQNTLMTSLLDLEARHIYSDYWTCNWLMFMSNEQIICGVINPDLNLGFNRYQPYVQTVTSDPDAAYVFDGSSAGSAADHTFAERFGTRYEHLTSAGYSIYLVANRGS